MGILHHRYPTAFRNALTDIIRRYRPSICMWLLPVIGFISLFWFLLRVLPKPSRASYPCQRAAFPLASGFVIWLICATSSLYAFRRSRQHFRRASVISGGMFLVIAAVAGLIAIIDMPQDQALALDSPNIPIGTGLGVHPGRVVWVHDPEATDWNGPGNGFFWEPEHTDVQRVDQMVSDAVRWLAGESTDTAAWHAILTHFNQTHGRGSRGYLTGEKFMIKVNFVGFISGNNVSSSTYNITGNHDYMNTTPQMIHAIIRQLVEFAGVDEADITVGDPLGSFPNEFCDVIRNDYPEVRFIDIRGGNASNPRRKLQKTDEAVYWSNHPNVPDTDYVYDAYVEADYLINLATLKLHYNFAGVTLCAKNHYGSLRYPYESGYYDLHSDLPANMPGYGNYHCNVDFIAHKHFGGKTVLYAIDGLYGGRHSQDGASIRWNMTPFNGDWPSSVLVSQDPVAIDSVGLDFIREEWGGCAWWEGTEDYLHEAALADNPPSGTFYDPDHDGDVRRVPSLGVHEHWNNATDKAYSRNLDPVHGQGIELISSEPVPPIPAPTDLAAVVFTDPHSIHLTWTDNASGPDQESGYVVQRKPYMGNHDNWHTLADDLPPDSESYTDTNHVYGNVEYHYRVRAVPQP